MAFFAFYWVSSWLFVFPDFNPDMILYWAGEISRTFSVWCQLAIQSHTRTKFGIRLVCECVRKDVMPLWLIWGKCTGLLHTLTYAKRRWLVHFIAPCKASIWWNAEKHNDWLYTGQEIIAPYTLKNKGASRCHKITVLSKWFHKEPLTSKELFHKMFFFWRKRFFRL